MAGGPLTDRERAQRAEARVAELEAEVAAWRANDQGDRLAAAYGEREDRLRRVLTTVGIDAGGPSPARMLLALLDAAGCVVAKRHLVEASRHAGSRADAPAEGIVNVYVSRLRGALAELGFPGVIRTDWGRGYYVDPADAARLRVALLCEVAS